MTRSGDEALLVVGVSHHERLAAMQRLRRADVGTFAECSFIIVSIPNASADHRTRPLRRIADALGISQHLFWLLFKAKVFGS